MIINPDSVSQSCTGLRGSTTNAYLILEVLTMSIPNNKNKIKTYSAPVHLEERENKLYRLTFSSIKITHQWMPKPVNQGHPLSGGGSA